MLDADGAEITVPETVLDNFVWLNIRSFNGGSKKTTRELLA